MLPYLLYQKARLAQARNNFAEFAKEHTKSTAITLVVTGIGLAYLGPKGAELNEQIAQAVAYCIVGPLAVLGLGFMVSWIFAPYQLYQQQALQLVTLARDEGDDIEHERIARQLLTWLTMADAIDAYCDPVLVARRDKYGDSFERSYMRAFEIGQEMDKVLNHGPTPGLNYPGAQEKYVELRKTKERHDEMARMAQTGIKDTWAALHKDLERQLLNGNLIARGFLEPHVGGRDEVDIKPTEWRILRCDVSNGSAFKVDTDVTIYSGLQIASVKAVTPALPLPPSTAPETPL